MEAAVTPMTVMAIEKIKLTILEAVFVIGDQRDILGQRTYHVQRCIAVGVRYAEQLSEKIVSRGLFWSLGKGKID